MSTDAMKNVSVDVGRIRVGDVLTDIRQNGQVAMSSRDPSKPQKFMVTEIHADGTIDLKPVHT